MPRVPYDPIQQIAPTEAATPSVRVATPPDAFGEGIAQATQGLGQVTVQAGNELWGRAVALQELQNETDAKNANVDFISKAGQLHADYNALQGDARVKAFPDYQKNLNTLYQTTRGGLGNPSAQRMFDGAAISTLNRSVFNAAGSAASAQREAASGAINSQESLDQNRIYNDPNDDGTFREAIEKIKQNAPTKAALSNAGSSPEVIAKIQQDGINELTYHRIIGMARNQPNTAYKLLDQYEKEGLIVGQHDLQARKMVEGLVSSVGMNTVANQVLKKYLQPDGTYSKSAQDMQAEAVDTAGKMYPDIESIGSSAQAALDRNYNQHAWGMMQDKRARDQQTSDYIVKGVRSVDMLPPDFVKQMTPTEIKAFPAQANNYERSQQVTTDQDTYHQLLGLYNNDNGKFMDTNIFQVPGISKGNIDFFLKLQRTAAANGDPRVSHAMTLLKGSNPQLLDDLGVTGKAKDPTTANQFVGALHDAIQSYQETNGKPPDEKTLTGEIFPTITRQVTQKGFIYNSQVPFFALPIPDKYKADYLKISPSATDPEISQNYNRQMFDQFFKSQKTSKDQGRVGSDVHSSPYVNLD